MRPKGSGQDSITTLLMRVRRRWGVFTTIFVFVAGVVVMARYLIVPQYVATSAVLIAPNQSPMENRATAPDSDPTEVESQVEIIRSPRLLRAILQQADVKGALQSACKYTKAHSVLSTIQTYITRRGILTGTSGSASCVFNDNAGVVEAIGKTFSIFQVGRSNVISVNFQSSSSITAALVVNSLVNAYISDNITAKSNARMTTAKWLEEEDVKLRASLTQKEQQIGEYRRDHGLLRGENGLVTQESLSSLTTQLNEAKARLAEATARLTEVQAVVSRGGDLSVVPTVVNAETIRDLRALEAQQVLELGLLTPQYGEHNPKVLAAANQLHNVRNSLSTEVRRLIGSLKAEALNAAGDEQALEAAVRKAKDEAGSAADADSAVQSLVRDADVDRQLYFVMASRAKELETETRAQNPDARLVNLAELPVRPSFPRSIPFFGVALLLGLLTGSAGAFVRDYRDNTLRDIDDFADDLDVPVLARIPADRSLTHRANFMSISSDNGTHFREAIRTLYAHLQLKTGMRTVLITSTSPREGKTSVAVAVAHFAAAAGHRVLLIEADLRMPVFAQIMPVNGSGLEGYFRTPSLVEPPIEIPYQQLPEFHVLPAGHPAQDSTELLGSARMTALLSVVREKYDFVIIDTPPANILMDACILARWTDGVIFVAKWGWSQPDLMRSTMRAIRNAGGNIIGTVIGMVDYKRTDATYGSTPLPAPRRYIGGR